MSEPTGRHAEFKDDDDSEKSSPWIDHSKPNQWHLDKTFSISHLISTLAIVIGLFSWGSKMDNRVSIAEVEQRHLTKDAEKGGEVIKDNFRQMQAALLRIETKLDTKADRK